jgi:hypothetical protein
MIYHRGQRRNNSHLKLDAFHLGACDCMNYRQLRCPFIEPGIDQLRYLLGWIAFAKSEDDFCLLPLELRPRKYTRRKK